VRIHVPWTPELPSRYATSPVPQLSSLLRYPKAGVSGSGPQTLGASSRLLEASSDYSLPSSVAGFSFDGHATSSNRREVRPLTLADQAEEQMNYMIRCLVNIISGYLNKPGLSPAIFQSTSPIRARPIVGDGAQISTKPDLYITVISSGKVYILLDYKILRSGRFFRSYTNVSQGRKLKSTMTPVQKHAQQVCHILSRSCHNVYIEGLPL
jgi:hypothetical protein